jgi:hypothetical protein
MLSLSGAVPMTLDLLDPLLYAGDPGPAYQWLRDEAPVYWDPHSSRVPAFAGPPAAVRSWLLHQNAF